MKNFATLLAFFPIFLSIVSAQHIDIINASWAGISSYMVFLGRVDKTIEKGIFRMIGTVIGACSALLIVNFFKPSFFQVLILVFIVTTLAIYYNNTTNHGYAWIYCSLVFFIILSHSIANIIENINFYAYTRILSVAYGSTITIFFNIILGNLSNFKEFVCKTKEKERIKNYFLKGYKNHIDMSLVFYALTGSLTLCFIIFIGKYLKLDIFFQAGTAVLFIINVPFASVKANGIKEIYKKATNRVLGATTGSLLGLFSFFIIKLNYNLYNLLIALVIILCLYIKHYEKYAYYSSQIFVAFCFVMLPKPLINENYTTIFSRCIGIVIAIITLYFSFVLYHIMLTLYNKLKKT